MGIDSGRQNYQASRVDFGDFEARLPIEKHPSQRLELFVIFTDLVGTRVALQMADDLAQRLDAHIELLMPYEVPYPLPLGRPPVPVGFLEVQIRNLTCNTGLDIAASIYLCRDKMRILKLLLKPHCLIVVGGKKRWWPTSAQRTARELERDGHHVIFAELR
jgi:hypothetical protein